ncbi:group III truncated hemoglobin [Ekhidna sp. MALMAid0563]|uniref:group III truncated hemoglobin n=1 Tax=Ekhidna sp. MALMAid0563 TaxID=3143937 RepID=UPI0032DF2779
MPDITTRQDIELLVDKFYEQVIQDDIIGEFFTGVVKLDWEVHIPIMYNFWETILLDHIVYKGNPMLKHIQLSQKKALESKHFERWLELWEKTIRMSFQGPKAEEAISRAKQIASLMKFKVENVS